MRCLPVVFISALMLAGCGALSAVSDATEPLDAFTLSPVRPAVAGSGDLHLVVPVATATGAIATDRILVKPTRIQAVYLPAARWIDPAPVLMQSLLVASLQASAGFRLVSRDDAGLSPDFILLVDLTDFQAEAPGGGQTTWTIRVGLTATAINDADRRILASRHFESTVSLPTDETTGVVQGFDTATATVLRDTTAWVVRQTR